MFLKTYYFKLISSIIQTWYLSRIPAIVEASNAPSSLKDEQFWLRHFLHLCWWKELQYYIAETCKTLINSCLNAADFRYVWEIKKYCPMDRETSETLHSIRNSHSKKHTKHILSPYIYISHVIQISQFENNNIHVWEKWVSFFLP